MAPQSWPTRVDYSIKLHHLSTWMATSARGLNPLRFLQMFTQKDGWVTMHDVSSPDGSDGSERTIITERKLVASDKDSDHQAYLVVIYGEELGKRIPLGELPVEAGRSTK